MGIRLDCVQGSYEWRMCRVGLLTASEFHRILTPKKLEVSKAGVASIAAELVAERAMMQPLEVDLAGFAERGVMLENEAVPWYEMQKDVTVERGGFYFDADVMIGASPDGLTPDAGLEVKSLAPAKHLRMMLGEEPSEYMAQVQACMWLCGRTQWDLLFYHPSLPSKIVPVNLDKEYVEKLNAAIGAVNEAAFAMQDRLQKAGVDFGPWCTHLQALARGEVPHQAEPTYRVNLGMFA